MYESLSSEGKRVETLENVKKLSSIHEFLLQWIWSDYDHQFLQQNLDQTLLNKSKWQINFTVALCELKLLTDVCLAFRNDICNAKLLESNHQNIILPAIFWFVPNENMFVCFSWRDTNSPYTRRRWVPRSASPTHTSSAGRTSAPAQTLEHTDQKSLVINTKHFISFNFMRVSVCVRALVPCRKCGCSGGCALSTALISSWSDGWMYSKMLLPVSSTYNTW